MNRQQQQQNIQQQQTVQREQIIQQQQTRQVFEQQIRRTEQHVQQISSQQTSGMFLKKKWGERNEDLLRRIFLHKSFKYLKKKKIGRTPLKKQRRALKRQEAQINDMFFNYFFLNKKKKPSRK